MGNNKADDKKIKNLISAIILLGGLFVGSLFVDVAQVFKGEGFSSKNLAKSDVFEAKGKTWVAFSEPAVAVKVINDENCEECDPAEVLVWLRRVAPTINAEMIAYDSKEGKNAIEMFGIKTIPAFIFSDTLEKTEFYTQAQIIFEKKENWHILKTQELGVSPGKFLETPDVSEESAKSGPVDAKAKVIVFSDFQCPYSKIFQKSMRDNMKEYDEKALFVFKQLPLEFHKQANNAALASECALEQNKFWEYGDKLFDKQSEWGSLEGTAKFKEYARILGLNQGQFNSCLDGQKYQGKIDEDIKAAQNFGISGTPAIFVNDQYKNASISTEQLKQMIEGELNK